jgi:hypothetical protein
MGQGCSKESGNVKGNGTAIEARWSSPSEFSFDCRGSFLKGLWKIGAWQLTHSHNPERLPVVELTQYGTSGVMNNFLEAVVYSSITADLSL